MGTGQPYEGLGLAALSGLVHHHQLKQAAHQQLAAGADAGGAHDLRLGHNLHGKLRTEDRMFEQRCEGCLWAGSAKKRVTMPATNTGTSTMSGRRGPARLSIRQAKSAWTYLQLKLARLGRELANVPLR